MLKYIVVEDEPLARESTIMKMSRSGLPIELAGQAEDGEEGLRLLEKFNPDLAIIDICMPEHDGLDFMKRARQLGFKTRLIITSGYASFDYARAGITAGAVSYLLKPFSEQDLKDAVNAAMGDLMVGDDMSVMEKIKSFIDQNYSQNVTLQMLSARFSYNPDYLSTLFSRAMGVNFNAYLTQARIDKAKILLAQTEMSVSMISKKVGFPDTKYFSRVFKRSTGLTPTEFTQNCRKKE
jgi:two-component system response regulator YesN